MALDDAGDDIGDVALRVAAVQLAGLDERGEYGPVLAAAVGAGEEGILAVERNGPDGSLDGVGVDLDAAVVEEEAEPVPSGECIADRLGELALLADALELDLQPSVEGAMVGWLRFWRTRRRSSAAWPRMSASTA